MNKVIIFSHESDIDGMGSIILGKLAFNEVDYVLLPNVEKLETTFRSYLQRGLLEQYDGIYITDLALYNPSLDLVNSSNLKDKVLVFDHHKRSITDNVNCYSFTRIITADQNGKKCGTQLFYEYLIQNQFVLNTKGLQDFVELTRQEDTWEWQKHGDFGQMAHDLAILFNAIGAKEYLDRMYYKLSLNNLFEFDLLEREIIQNKKAEYETNIKKIMLEVEYFLDEDNNKFGIVFADYQYRNEIADYIQKNGNPAAIKYFILVALEKGEYGQKSYRAIAPCFDVNLIASKHGGGGHVGAAMVNVTEEQKRLALTLDKRNALKYLADSSNKLK